MITVTAERDAALEKCAELEKRIEEFMNLSQDDIKVEKTLSSARKSSARYSDANGKSQKPLKQKSERPCDQEQSYSSKSLMYKAF